VPKISRSLIIIWFIVLAVVIAAVIAAVVVITMPPRTGIELTSSELIADLQQGIDPWDGNCTAPATLTIKGMSLTAVIDGKTYTTTVPSNFDAFQVFASQIGNGTVTVNYQGASRWSSWDTIVVTGVASLLIGIFLGYFWRRQRQA
jgi:hypothetical protein